MPEPRSSSLCTANIDISTAGELDGSESTDDPPAEFATWDSGVGVHGRRLSLDRCSCPRAYEADCRSADAATCATTAHRQSRAWRIASGGSVGLPGWSWRRGLSQGCLWMMPQQTSGAGRPVRSAAMRMKATVAHAAERQKSSVCHQATSSSRSTSTPPCWAAPGRALSWWRRRPGGGGPRPETCCSAGAGAPAGGGSRPRRRRAPARRGGSGGRWPRPGPSAASVRACTDGSPRAAPRQGPSNVASAAAWRPSQFLAPGGLERRRPPAARQTWDTCLDPPTKTWPYAMSEADPVRGLRNGQRLIQYRRSGWSNPCPRA